MGGTVNKTLYAVVTVLTLLVVPACSRREGAEKTDTAMVAYLSKVRSLHHEANLKEDGNDLAGAIDALKRIPSATKPREAPEIDEVLADAYARLAELELKRGGLGNAKAYIDEGLRTAPTETYFRGHLLEVSGLILEASSHTLTDAGDLKGAVEAREKAIRQLEESITIQEHVIARTLGDGGKR
jgi:tetratricopeptide (TPR) repeat protein